MSTAILVADHFHIAFIEEDEGQQQLCEPSEDSVARFNQFGNRTLHLRANWEVSRGDFFVGGHW